jgi:hypothetical protein
VPSQQLQGQLKTQHSVDLTQKGVGGLGEGTRGRKPTFKQSMGQAGRSMAHNYIMDTQNIKPKINYRKVLEENTLKEKVIKQIRKETKMRGNKNYITQSIIIIK